MEKLRGTATRLFYLVFVLAMGWLLFNVVFLNPWFDYSPLIALPLAAVWLAAFFGLWKLAGRLQGYWSAHEKRCLLGFFLLLSAVQLLFYWQAGSWPNCDLERVYTGAYNYTITGIIEDPYLDYFYKYPNNMPLTILLQFFFRVFYRLTGSTGFLWIGIAYNVVCIDLAYLFLYLCGRELGGVRLGSAAMGLLLLCVPLHCYITTFYTDTTTMLYPPLALWLWIQMHKAKSRRVWLAALAALAVAVGFGMKQKYSVVIVLIAIVIDGLLRAPKAALAVAASTLAAFLLWSSLFDGFMYAHILDREKAKDAATPFLSWIMMSLKGDGTHNPEDNYLIWYWPTAEERKWQAKEEIKRRLQEYGPIGYLQFLNRKGVRSFGSGDLDVQTNPALSPMRDTFIVQCTWERGRYWDEFRYVAQGYHIALFSLLIAGAAAAARRRDWRCFVPHLSFFGLYLFLLLWEARQRYLINYMGMFTLSAAFGLLMLEEARRRRAEKAARPAGTGAEKDALEPRIPAAEGENPPAG